MTNPGEKVLVPTKVKPGAFPGEKLVTIETSTGSVSGFTKTDYVFAKPGGQYLLAEVKAVTNQTLTVKLFGSFFTTTGVAEIPKSTPILKAAG